MLAGFPIHNGPRIDREPLGGFALGQPELQASLSNMLAERLGLLEIALWFPALKPDADQWQKGNAAMRLDRRDELEPRGELRVPDDDGPVRCAGVSLAKFIASQND